MRIMTRKMNGLIQAAEQRILPRAEGPRPDRGAEMRTFWQPPLTSPTLRSCSQLPQRPPKRKIAYWLPTSTPGMTISMSRTVIDD